MDWTQLLPLVAIIILFWLIVIRPAQRRQKAMTHLQQSLEVGQRVMLASGIFGTITSLTAERARLEVAEGVVVEVVRGAVSSVDAPEAATDGSDHA